MPIIFTQANGVHIKGLAKINSNAQAYFDYINKYIGNINFYDY